MKLTREEINILEPGQRLDELIAEYAMLKPKPGLTHEPDHINLIDFGSWYCLPDYYNGDRCEYTPHAFSSDIRFAWMALMQFGKYEVSTALGGDHFCELSDFTDGKMLYGAACATTPALAICRASLKAVMNVR